MSGVSLVTAPTADPVSLSEAKAHCRVTDSADDGLLAGYLMAARTHVENVTGLSLLTQTWDCLFDGDWPLVWDATCCTFVQLISLPKFPVQSVTSVSYVDTTGATQVLAGGNYQLVKERGPAYIVPSYNAIWPTVRSQPNSITVRVVCGFGPYLSEEPIRQAILLLVGHFYDNREAVGSSMNELPFAVNALLSPYRLNWL